VKAKIYFLNLGKAALAVLHGVLHSALTPSTGLSMEQTGIQPILKLLPVLGTSLDEYDTSSREISLSCLTTLLNCLPPTSLQLNSVLELYPAIVKRLDDSLDDIRLEACATFSAYVKCIVYISCYCSYSLILQICQGDTAKRANRDNP